MKRLIILAMGLFIFNFLLWPSSKMSVYSPNQSLSYCNDASPNYHVTSDCAPRVIEKLDRPGGGYRYLHQVITTNQIQQYYHGSYLLYEVHEKPYELHYFHVLQAVLGCLGIGLAGAMMCCYCCEKIKQLKSSNKKPTKQGLTVSKKTTDSLSTCKAFIGRVRRVLSNFLITRPSKARTKKIMLLALGMVLIVFLAWPTYRTSPYNCDEWQGQYTGNYNCSYDTSIVSYGGGLDYLYRVVTTQKYYSTRLTDQGYSYHTIGDYIIDSNYPTTDFHPSQAGFWALMSGLVVLAGGVTIPLFITIHRQRTKRVPKHKTAG